MPEVQYVAEHSGYEEERRAVGVRHRVEEDEEVVLLPALRLRLAVVGGLANLVTEDVGAGGDGRSLEEDRERQSWLVADDRVLFRPKDQRRFLNRLRNGRALWLQVADGCGWPWRTEVWIEDGHRYIDQVLDNP